MRITGLDRTCVCENRHPEWRYDDGPEGDDERRMNMGADLIYAAVRWPVDENGQEWEHGSELCEAIHKAVLKALEDYDNPRGLGPLW
jgi:hypothetical protein